jgi:hypothetical protein
MRRAGPAIRDVIAHYQTLTKASFEKDLVNAVTDKAEQERLRAWADLMARRFLHTTLAGLRSLAANADPSAVAVFLKGLSESLPSRDGAASSEEPKS